MYTIVSGTKSRGKLAGVQERIVAVASGPFLDCQETNVRVLSGSRNGGPEITEPPYRRLLTWLAQVRQHGLFGRESCHI